MLSNVVQTHQNASVRAWARSRAGGCIDEGASRCYRRGREDKGGAVCRHVQARTPVGGMREGMAMRQLGYEMDMCTAGVHTCKYAAGFTARCRACIWRACWWQKARRSACEQVSVKRSVRA